MIRIGIGSGELILENIGDFDRGVFNFTILGDTVNIASYLWELAKDFDPGILIDASTFKKIAEFEVSEKTSLDDKVYYQLKGLKL